MSPSCCFRCYLPLLPSSCQQSSAGTNSSAQKEGPFPFSSFSSSGEGSSWENLSDHKKRFLQAPLFSFSNIRAWVGIHEDDVYDGDTIRALFLLRNEKYAIRLEGVDTPEMRSRHPEEKIWARVARRVVQLVVLAAGNCMEFWGSTTAKSEKYGRCLGDLCMPSTEISLRPSDFEPSLQEHIALHRPSLFGAHERVVSLSEFLCRLGLAAIYDGRKKNPTRFAHLFSPIPPSQSH
mmetsp:Transcript_20158/g.51451  ORF Transcript_20158/g.51451 Transcript_20158/m.51451 type:complete len:235 (-) Transcript_20158:1599-2303(-)